MENTNQFLQKRIIEIEFALCQQNIDMYELIGSVRDVFSSAYLAHSIADPAIVRDLWNVLLEVFIHSDVFDNKFESIFAMSYIYHYAERQNISLNLDELKKWRIEQEGKYISSDLIECINDILSK